MKDAANMKILPPIIVGGALALGIAIALLFPAQLLPSNLAASIGIVLIVLSVPLVLAAARAKPSDDRA